MNGKAGVAITLDILGDFLLIMTHSFIILNVFGSSAGPSNDV